MKKDFKTDLIQGLKDELDFIEQAPFNLKKNTENYDFDLLLTDTNEKIELKSDSYSIVNFFIEEFSDFHRKSDGAIQQSINHNVDYFIYWFKNNNRYFVFRPQELMDFCVAYINENKLRRVLIKNTTHTTSGYLVSVQALTEIMLVEDSKDLKLKKTKLKNGANEY